jgi:cell division protein FtsB
MASAQVLYGEVIRDVIVSKDLRKMKATAAQAKKQINDLQSGLKGLQAAITKLGKK